MMLGTDVSALSTTAATAAAQGLSIVIPVYNEAAGLALLHERLGELAKGLRQRYGLGCEGVYIHGRRRAATLSIRLISSRSWSATGSMAVTTWSIPPKRIATTNRLCGDLPCTASTR